MCAIFLFWSLVFLLLFIRIDTSIRIELDKSIRINGSKTYEHEIKGVSRTYIITLQNNELKFDHKTDRSRPTKV